MPEPTPRMRQVFDLISAGKSRQQIADELGIGTTRVTNITRKLIERGLIIRKGHIPAAARWTEEYPWEIVEDEALATYRLALPQGARLRLAYPQETERDVSVAPARVIRWNRWTVQGLLMQRPDGKPPTELLADHRIVVIDDLKTGWGTQFRAPRWRQEQPGQRAPTRWRESDTRRLPWPVDEYAAIANAPSDMTLVIACAIGVEAVMDLSAEEKGSVSAT